MSTIVAQAVAISSAVPGYLVAAVFGPTKVKSFDQLISTPKASMFQTQLLTTSEARQHSS